MKRVVASIRNKADELLTGKHEIVKEYITVYTKLDKKMREKIKKESELCTLQGKFNEFNCFFPTDKTETKTVINCLQNRKVTGINGIKS